MRTGLLFRLGLGLPLTAAAWFAAAQEPPGRDADWRVPLRQARVAAIYSPQLIELVQPRAPIATRPFELIRPGTSNVPLRRDEILELPDGRRVNAGEYFDQLNAFERFLNASGQTMRRPPGVPRAERRIVDLQRFRPETGLLERQRAVLPRSTGARVPVQLYTQPLVPPRRIQVSMSLRQPPPEAFRRDAELRAIDPRSPAYEQLLLRGGITLGVDENVGVLIAQRLPPPQPFGGELGDARIASAYFRAGLIRSVEGFERVQLGASARAGITLVGVNFPLLEADVLAAASSTQNGGRQRLLFRGSHLIPELPESYQAARFDLEPAIAEQAVDESVGFVVQLGPIPLSVKFGAQGRVGLNTRLVADQRVAQVAFSPYVDVRAFVEAGVSVAVAGAGVYGDLTLVRNTLNVEGVLGLRGRFEEPMTVAGYQTYRGAPVRRYFETTRPQVYSWFGVDNELKLFGGNIGVYAFIYVPAADLPPWEKLEFRHAIVTWPGITVPTRIAHHEEVINLTRPLTAQERNAIDAAARLARFTPDKLALSPGVTIQPAQPKAVPSPPPPAAAAVAPVNPALPAPTGAAPGPREAMIAIAPRAFEQGVNRPGGDYWNFAPSTVERCQSSCASAAQCRAWTWVAPGVQGPDARCWLKSAVPAPVQDGCCVSGVVR
jgi:hypothetical protein